MKKYVLTVSEKQAYVLKEALEIYARISMGQYRYLDQFWWCNEVSSERMGEVRDLLSSIEANYRESFGPRGIRNTDESSRNAWDLMQVIRKRLALDRLKPGEKLPMIVDYDEFYKTGTEPMANIAEAK